MGLTQQRGFDWFEEGQVPAIAAARTGTFTDNMKLPVHRWFRYSAGFSSEWVESVVRDHGRSDGLLFDPFAGSGTSLLAAQSAGMPAVGAEPHPFVLRIASAKLAWPSDPARFQKRAGKLLERAKADCALADSHPALLLKCYTEPALAKLDALRTTFLAEPPGEPTTELLWLTITAILRECSGVGTAQWQYVLPNKTKARVVDPLDAFSRRVSMFATDMRARSSALGSDAPAIRVVDEDARRLSGLSNLAGAISLVVTSPPYPNNYDYADATRLEMTFWRELDCWGDLQGLVRHKLVRSCSQHSAAEKLELEALLATEQVHSIRDELSSVCRELSEVRETKGGRKAYHTMIAAYFNDLALTWRALRRVCATGATVCFVIGDSAPYGVHIPAERWLARLAEAEGFSFSRFEKLRDRNVKWKNRKHRVPLHEGNLWMRG